MLLTTEFLMGVAFGALEVAALTTCVIGVTVYVQVAFVHVNLAPWRRTRVDFYLAFLAPHQSGLLRCLRLGLVLWRHCHQRKWALQNVPGDSLCLTRSLTSSQIAKLRFLNDSCAALS